MARIDITIVESAVARKKQRVANEEELYVGTAESEHVEMYLKAMWYIRERGEDIKVSSIAKLLNVTQPSVVQMLSKLNRSQLVRYSKGSVQMTTEGEQIGNKMMRNTRLLEVLMKDALKIDVDEEMICRHRASYDEYVHRCTMHALKAPKDVSSWSHNSKGQLLFVDFYSRRFPFLAWTTDDEIALLT